MIKFLIVLSRKQKVLLKELEALGIVKYYVLTQWRTLVLCEVNTISNELKALLKGLKYLKREAISLRPVVDADRLGDLVSTTVNLSQYRFASDKAKEGINTMFLRFYSDLVCTNSSLCEVGIEIATLLEYGFYNAIVICENVNTVASSVRRVVSKVRASACDELVLRGIVDKTIFRFSTNKSMKDAFKNVDCKFICCSMVGTTCEFRKSKQVGISNIPSSILLSHVRDLTNVAKLKEVFSLSEDEVKSLLLWLEVMH